jgi:hypothetical protein
MANSLENLAPTICAELLARLLHASPQSHFSVVEGWAAEQG